jgi:hypothetical protein
MQTLSDLKTARACTSNIAQMPMDANMDGLIDNREKYWSGHPFNVYVGSLIGPADIMCAGWVECGQQVRSASVVSSLGSSPYRPQAGHLGSRALRGEDCRAILPRPSPAPRLHPESPRGLVGDTAVRSRRYLASFLWCSEMRTTTRRHSTRSPTEHDGRALAIV